MHTEGHTITHTNHNSQPCTLTESHTLTHTRMLNPHSPWGASLTRTLVSSSECRPAPPPGGPPDPRVPLQRRWDLSQNDGRDSAGNEGGESVGGRDGLNSVFCRGSSRGGEFVPLGIRPKELKTNIRRGLPVGASSSFVHNPQHDCDSQIARRPSGCPEVSDVTVLCGNVFCSRSKLQQQIRLR